MAPFHRRSSRRNAKAASTNTPLSKQPSNARRAKVKIASNLPCSFFPASFHDDNAGMICTNCANYLSIKCRRNSKPQHLMGRSYQCTRLTSTCYFKPLTVVASYQISAHRHREENDEDSTLPDLDYVEDSDSDSDSEDEDNEDNDKSISVGSLQTNTFGASTISSTMASHHAVLETERNKHQITSQKLEIATIHLERAKRELEMSMENTKKLKKEITHLQSNVIPASLPSTPAVDRDKAFAKTIELAARKIYPRCHNKTKATKVFSMLKSGDVFDCKAHIENVEKTELKKVTRDVFRPWKLRKKCDESDQGGINVSGCGQIREVQNLQRYERGFLPAKSPIARAGKKLEEEARKYIDWEVRHLSFGEVAQYKNFGKFIIETIDAYGLKGIALTRAVQIGWSSDGADLTKLRKHTSLGMRILDLEAKVPGTEELLYHDGFDEKGDPILKNYHSKEIANFMIICATNETNSLYRDHMRTFFEFINKANEEGIEYEGQRYYISSTFPADMSCHWKVLNMGGACKTKGLFCHHCGCHSNELTSFRTDSLRCDWCKEHNNPKCYHFAVDTEEEINRKRQVCIDLERKYTYLFYNDVNSCAPQLKRDTFLSDPSMLSKHNLPNHIEYEVQSPSCAVQFSNALTRQLLSRRIIPEAGLEVRRKRLKQVLHDEDLYFYLKRTLQRYDNSSEDRLVPVAWAVPCIMHMHNRVVEKLTAVVIRKGFSLRATQEKKIAYKNMLEHTINCTIFGSFNSQSKWTLPMTEDKATCKDISFSDGKAKKVMANIALIVTDTFNTGEFVRVFKYNSFIGIKFLKIAPCTYFFN